MITKIPFVISGIAGIAAAVPSTSGHLELSKQFPVYRVHPGESLVISGPCGSAKNDAREELVGGDFTGLSFTMETCAGGAELPTWRGSVIHFSSSVGTYGAEVAVVGDTPVTPPKQPDQG